MQLARNGNLKHILAISLVASLQVISFKFSFSISLEKTKLTEFRKKNHRESTKDSCSHVFAACLPFPIAVPKYRCKINGAETLNIFQDMFGRHMSTGSHRPLHLAQSDTTEVHHCHIPPKLLKHQQV